jgi:hypothetical protein
MPVQFEPVQGRCLETDEPIQREPVAAFPNARRYRMLDREAFHWWPPADGSHAGETYLELPKSSISNREYCTIAVLSYPDGWFADNVLDVVLEMISLQHDAESHEICIANSLMGQCLYFPGLGDLDGNNFAGMAEYKKLFETKKWIFIPINDGMVEKDTSSSQGAHWSFIAVNRRDQVAHYVDSLFSADWRYQDLAHTIAKGLGNILGEQYEFTVEYNAPGQWEHNMYNGSRGWDVGPCGPFVVIMIKIYVEAIIQARNIGQEDCLGLQLGHGFGERFRQRFDSLRVRCDIVESMARLKVRIDADRLTGQHDAAALAGLEDTAEVIDDQQPLFDKPARIFFEGEVDEGMMEQDSETDSSTSPILEVDFDSDDLEDEWRIEKLDSDSRIEYGPFEDVVLSSSPCEAVKGGVDHRKSVQAGVCHRTGFGHRLTRTSGVQLNRDIMVIADDAPAVEIKLSPSQ